LPVNRELTPSNVGPPSANYALATVSEAPGRMLHTSGVGPVRPDGTVPDGSDGDGIEVQATVVWSTLLSLLSEAGLSPTDVVSVATYVVVEPHPEFDLSARLSRVMAARDAALGGHRCASTLVPVPALATPSWKLEIAVVAIGR
jgi:enamine deaminase RidA (YjgF/YER057c/UK114 family)